MIKYSIKKDDLIVVKVSGHANYGTEGNDIVCASVSSILTMTINLIDNLGYKFENVKLEKGISEFSIKNDEVIDKIVTTLEELLQNLAKKHPNNIKEII